MELLLLGLLGVALTWGVVEAVRDDGDDTPPDPIRDPDADEELFATSNSLLDAGGGNDTIIAGGEQAIIGNATLLGGTGDDLFELVISNSEVFAGQGNDTITGYASASQLNGGHGDDRFDIIADHGVTLNGGMGDDTITAIGERSFIYGGDGDDVVDATSLVRSAVYGGDGDDRLSAATRLHNNQGGNTALYGGLGDDTLRATVEHDPAYYQNYLHGGAGEDVFEIAFNPPQHSEALHGGQLQQNERLVTIADFQSGKDQLHLELRNDYGNAAPVVSLVPLADGAVRLDISYQVQDSRLEDPEATVPLTSSIWFPDGIAMTDIRILPPAAA